MQKGKFGIQLSFYAVLGLVLAFLGQTLLCGLLLGFVILAEKDPWTSRQTMQAFFVSLFMSLVSKILGALNVFQNIPLIGSVFSVIFSIIEGIIALLVLIFLIIGLSLYFGFTSTGVDNYAHVGGLVCGFLTAMLLYRPGFRKAESW